MERIKNTFSFNLYFVHIYKMLTRLKQKQSINQSINKWWILNNRFIQKEKMFKTSPLSPIVRSPFRRTDTFSSKKFDASIFFSLQYCTVPPGVRRHKWVLRLWSPPSPGEERRTGQGWQHRTPPSRGRARIHTHTPAARPHHRPGSWSSPPCFFPLFSILTNFIFPLKRLSGSPKELLPATPAKSRTGPRGAESLNWTGLSWFSGQQRAFTSPSLRLSGSLFLPPTVTFYRWWRQPWRKAAPLYRRKRHQ